MNANEFCYDYDEYGNKVFYDLCCPNKSFLLTAKELKIKGIKKYYFPLRINNPSIARYDPYDDNLPPVIQQKILEECMNNLWYFCSRVVKVKTNKGNVPFYLHRGLCAAIWCFEHSQDFMLTEPRQTYKTTGIIASILQWAYQFTQNTNIHMIGKETANTQKNLADLKDDIDLLPKWMQFKQYHDNNGKIKKVREATKMIANKTNSVKTFPKALSLATATNIGRGDSAPIIYYDEVEHTNFFPEIFRNTAFTYREASKGAEAVGKPHCRILTGTPGNKNTSIGRDVAPLIDSMIPWTEKIYDMTEAQLKDYKQIYMDNFDEEHEGDGKSSVEVLRMTYDYKQLRKNDDWVNDQLKLCGDKATLKREILLIRGEGTNDSPISPEDLEYLNAHKIRSEKELILQDKWLFKIYPHGADLVDKSYYFDPDIPYLVGIDPSAGSGNDNFAMTIINPWNMRVAAEFQNKYLSGPAACEMIEELVNKYIPKAVLIPEKNSMGYFLIQMLLRTSVAENLYWSEKSASKQLDSLVEEDPRNRELRLASQMCARYGIYTGKNNRDAMFTLLLQYVSECKDLLNTEYLVDDISSLTRKASGRIEAEKGSHDDSLMSYLIAIYIYHTGDNIEYFGIDKHGDPLAHIDIKQPRQFKINFDAINKASTSKIPIVPSVKSYQEEVIEDQIRMESQIKEMSQKLSFIHDPLHKKSDEDDTQNNTVDISPSFFYNINRR